MKADRDLLAGLLLFAVLASLPWWALRSGYTLGIGVTALSFVALAMSWNLISGIGGQLSIGHAAFYGLGGYTSSLLLVRLGVTPWIGMFAGGVVAVVAGVLMGYPAFRLSGVYFKLLTFVSALILEILARHFSNFTGGDIGINIPLLGNAPAMYQFKSPIPYFYIILVLAALYFLLTRWVLRARFGYYLQALRDDQTAAEVLGIDSLRMKLIGFAVSAFMASLVGSFYAQFLLFIDPGSAFGMFTSIKIALAAIVGGVGTLWGPVIGGLFLIPLAELANAKLASMVTGVDVVFYSLVLMLLALFLPKGLVSLPAVLRAQWAKWTKPRKKGQDDGALPGQADRGEPIAGLHMERGNT